MVDQNGGKFEHFENFEKKLHVIQIDFFSAEVHWVIYKIRRENKKIDIIGTLRKLWLHMY